LGLVSERPYPFCLAAAEDATASVASPARVSNVPSVYGEAPAIVAASRTAAVLNASSAASGNIFIEGF